MNGLGGTAYAVVFDPANTSTVALDGSPRCPAHTREDMFDPLPGVGGGLYGFPPTRGDQAETGPLSVLVPTAPAVLFELHRRFGRLSFEAVTEPAIRLAEEGFVPDWVFAVHAAAGYRRLKRCPAAFALYTREDGSPFVPFGEEDRLRNPDLAGSLRLPCCRRPRTFLPGIRGAAARRSSERGRWDSPGIRLRADSGPRSLAPPVRLSGLRGGHLAGEFRGPHPRRRSLPSGRLPSRGTSDRLRRTRDRVLPSGGGVASVGVSGSLRLPGRSGECSGAPSRSAES